MIRFQLVLQKGRRKLNTKAAKMIARKKKYFKTKGMKAPTKQKRRIKKEAYKR